VLLVLEQIPGTGVCEVRAVANGFAAIAVGLRSHEPSSAGRLHENLTGRHRSNLEGHSNVPLALLLEDHRPADSERRPIRRSHTLVDPTRVADVIGTSGDTHRQHIDGELFRDSDVDASNATDLRAVVRAPGNRDDRGDQNTPPSRPHQPSMT